MKRLKTKSENLKTLFGRGTAAIESCWTVELSSHLPLLYSLSSIDEYTAQRTLCLSSPVHPGDRQCHTMLSLPPLSLDPELFHCIWPVTRDTYTSIQSHEKSSIIIFIRHQTNHNAKTKQKRIDCVSQGTFQELAKKHFTDLKNNGHVSSAPTSFVSHC